jgi:4-carboxymuconolactone decarboxylase
MTQSRSPFEEMMQAAQDMAKAMNPLLSLAGLTMQGVKNESVLRQCVRHLLEIEAKPQEISETIDLMSMFAGIPAVTRAMEVASEVMDPNEDKET